MIAPVHAFLDVALIGKLLTSALGKMGTARQQKTTDQENREKFENLLQHSSWKAQLVRVGQDLVSISEVAVVAAPRSVEALTVIVQARLHGDRAPWLQLDCDLKRALFNQRFPR